MTLPKMGKTQLIANKGSELLILHESWFIQVTLETSQLSDVGM